MNIHLLIVRVNDSIEWDKMAASLTNKGITVHSASSANEVYKILKNETINVVLSEYHFPKTSSLKFLKKIKEVNPQVEIIFLSSKASLSQAIEAMREGAYDFYEFPVNMRLLLTVIEKAIEKQTLTIEKTRLEQKLKDRFDPGKMFGKSKAIARVVEVVKAVAPKNVNVLITGETGTGKEVVADIIHYNSSRSSKPFFKINCAAFNENLLESELFGHEKGAFTGAISKRVGRFEAANGGTIFLDEIGDLPSSTQIKLLRVLQEKAFERVGENIPIKVDVRIIAATNQDLKKLIDMGKFRDDLYYRLNIVHVEIPPLRERKEDIPLIVNVFICELNKEEGYQIRGMSKEAMQILLKYQWPGNVRELENAIESAAAIVEKDIIGVKHLPAFLFIDQGTDNGFYPISKNLTLQEMEQEIIRFTLERTGGNKTEAAKLLDIGLRTMQRKTKAP
jgi:DNA-binding NtrC family response regulator